MQQAERYAGIGGMEQRTLAFDEIPAAIEAGWRDPFGAAGDEIGDHRIDGHAGTGDENAGLAGGTKIRREAALAHGALECEDRKSVVSGKSVSVRVDLGGRRILKQKKKYKHTNTHVSNTKHKQ